MGLFDDDDELEAIFAEAKAKSPRYPAYVANLDEGTVQAIFERCLIRVNSKRKSEASLFPVVAGYIKNPEKLIEFDAEELLINKKVIEYLYGQLQEVHTSNPKKFLTIDDYNTTYQGTNWTKDKATLLKFLYLGVSDEVRFIFPFSAVRNNVSFITGERKPTLSPKDPAFPEWWEQHKAEWEG